MADSKTDGPKAGQQLEGQTNIVPWKRLFERAARAAGILDILTGDEAIITKKPVKSDYLETADDPAKPAGRSMRPRAKAGQTTIVLQPPDGTPEDQSISINHNKDAFAEFKMDMEEYKDNKQKVLKARKLIEDWVSDNIILELEEELEDPEDPAAAYAYIMDTYKVNEAFVRKEILSKVTTLKLGSFDSMSAYFNQHRQYKVDLKRAGYSAYGDDEMATNILAGLTNSYRPFINHYEFDKLKNGDDSHDIKFLYKALLAEEKKVETYTKEKKEREAATKKKTSKQDADKSTNQQPAKDTGKPDVTCEHCNKPGHTDDKCWTLHPELMPKSLKEKIKAKKIKTEPVAGLAGSDVDHFRNALAETEGTDK